MHPTRSLWTGIGLLGREILATRGGGLPRSAMLRNGAAIGAGFLAFMALGEVEAALVCAVFTNFLCFVDRGRSLKERLWTQVVAALCFAAATGVGGLVDGSDPLILVTTFALASFAGFVHGTRPGVEAIPRFAIACFVASAYLPVGTTRNALAVSVGTLFSIIAVRVDDHVRHGARGIRVAHVDAAVTYPGPRFSLVYGAAAVCGLGTGLLWGQERPYWVPITTLLVMQPDRRANTVRALQRFIGTILGVVAAFAIVRLVPLELRPGVILVVLVVLPFLWPLGYERNYAAGVALISTWVLLLIALATSVGPAAMGEGSLPVFLARLSNTAIGCALALFGSLVVLETREE